MSTQALNSWSRSSAEIPIKQVSQNIWEVPQDYQPGMKVPARIYADEDLLAKMRTDRTIQQCVNVTHLNGIYKYAITMPDGHEGYGFPIGGVAATDYDEGLISPGGVGYDINCIRGSSLVLSDYGYRRPISSMSLNWKSQRVGCIEEQTRFGETDLVQFMEQKPSRRVYRLRTLTGHEIFATEDHPFLTPTGMVELGKLGKSRVAVFPFEGVDYVEPTEFIIADRSNIRSLSVPGNPRQIVNELEKRNLLPLTSTSEKLPVLLKLMGFILGDGTLVFTSRSPQAWFYGDKEDLEEVRSDVKKLGFNPSRIYHRIRDHKIETKYGKYQFKHDEYSFVVRARSFITLLFALGVPLGNKSKQAYSLPAWLFNLRKWQKRLFLSTLFGAELSAPATLTGHGYNFCMPQLGQNKNEAGSDSGAKLLSEIAALIEDFDVKAQVTRPEENVHKGIDGHTNRFRLLVSTEPANLIRFWSMIGYEYNKRKAFLANVAVHYLRLKQRVLGEKPIAARIAITQKISVGSSNDTYSEPDTRYSAEGPPALSLSVTGSRVGSYFPKFDEFLPAATEGLGSSGAVWDEVVSIEKVDNFNENVFDLTTASDAHNFIANGFVVSNCGVRLIRTNLTEDQVRPVLPRLVDTIFNFIPSGLGSRGQIKLSPIELDKAVTDGLDWAVDKGYAWPEDPKTIEEEGCMEAADPSKVSSSARSRGAPQLGSLGSGNHFIEIERADRIFDERIAERLGIHKKGQILVLIHTGSRGYGHQICSDYLKVMERATGKYNIDLPDRELAACPSKSPEAEDYIPAMSAACNFAWINRQMITHWARQAFEKVFAKSPDSMDMRIVYDVCHNVAKIESHQIDGEATKVIVHRKGATRSFPPGHPDVPAQYRDVGQPVLIPGSMGTSSWVLIGTPKAMELSFGTTAHGAGRFMSRSAAKRKWRGADLKKQLESRGIVIRAASMEVVAEEAPDAYKDVDRVADVSDQLGIGKKVVRMTPIGVAKG